MKPSRIPESAIRRLSRYYRYLEQLDEKEGKVICSAQLAGKCLVNPNQMRKDLNFFGEFGTRGLGYQIRDLLSDIRHILGLNREWRIAVIGVGDLGFSLLAYNDFLRQCYKIVAAFDVDPFKVIGMASEKLGHPVEVFHIDRIGEVARERKIEIGLITTPPSEAQNVANMLVDAKVRGILNFTPTQVSVPAGYFLKDIFFTGALDNLAYLPSND